MPPFELLTFASDRELARTVASEWLDTVEAANRRGRPQHVALSGGRITRQFFSAVAEGSQQRGTSLANVHFFWADERCVPPQDPESNFALADQLLLQPSAIPAQNIHRIRGEDPPEQAAASASADLRRSAPSNGQGQPVLDIVFLGMGEDGHVASLFPNARLEDSNSSNPYKAVVATKPPPHRITLGYAALAAANEVWVLASGVGKERALQTSLAAAGQTPLARVLQARNRTRIFTDIRVDQAG